MATSLAYRGVDGNLRPHLQSEDRRLWIWAFEIRHSRWSGALSFSQELRHMDLQSTSRKLNGLQAIALWQVSAAWKRLLSLRPGGKAGRPHNLVSETCPMLPLYTLSGTAASAEAAKMQRTIRERPLSGHMMYHTSYQTVLRYHLSRSASIGL